MAHRKYVENFVIQIPYSTVGNRFNEGRQNVLKDVFFNKKPNSFYKAFQCDQNGVIFSIVEWTCQKLFPFFRTYTLFYLMANLNLVAKINYQIAGMAVRIKALPVHANA